MGYQVAIIGLGCVGTSIGLAVRQEEPDVEIVGHDIEPSHARQARKMDAVHRTHWNLPAACEDANLVVLALPLSAIEETMEAIGPHLKEGCVVTDTAPLKVPVLEWAREHLPEYVLYAGGFPVPSPAFDDVRPLKGAETASAALFANSLYCITPAPDTDSHAVEILLELIDDLSAKPLFLDPVEHDGLQAGVGTMPALIAVALLQSTINSPGWREMRKVAGHDFAALAQLAAANPQGRRETAQLNRESLLRRLDMFMEEIEHLRRWLLEGNEESLEEAYTVAAEDYERWRIERAEGKWGESPSLGEMPGFGEHIGRILFGGLAGRRPPEEE